MLTNRLHHWREAQCQAEAGSSLVLRNSRQSTTCKRCLLEAEARVRHARPVSTRSKIIVALRSLRCLFKRWLFFRCGELWWVCEATAIASIVCAEMSSQTSLSQTLDRAA